MHYWASWQEAKWLIDGVPCFLTLVPLYIDFLATNLDVHHPFWVGLLWLMLVDANNAEAGSSKVLLGPLNFLECLLIRNGFWKSADTIQTNSLKIFFMAFLAQKVWFIALEWNTKWSFLTFINSWYTIQALWQFTLGLTVLKGWWISSELRHVMEGSSFS